MDVCIRKNSYVHGNSCWHAHFRGVSRDWSRGVLKGIDEQWGKIYAPALGAYVIDIAWDRVFYGIYRHEHEGELPCILRIKHEDFSCYVFYITTTPYLPCNNKYIFHTLCTNNRVIWAISPCLRAYKGDISPNIALIVLSWVACMGRYNGFPMEKFEAIK